MWADLIAAASERTANVKRRELPDWIGAPANIDDDAAAASVAMKANAREALHA